MDDANPMGPLAGVKPSEIECIEPTGVFSNGASVRVKLHNPKGAGIDPFPTYEQLAAWASEQAQRFERVYPVEVRGFWDGTFAAFFAYPDHPHVRCGDLTREQAATIFRDGLPRHEVFPAKSVRNAIDAARAGADS